MTEVVQNLVRAADSAIARAYLKLFRERNSLIAFLFHSLFRGEAEIAAGVVDPLERTTVPRFRQLVEYYVDNGYRFISPIDLLAGLDAGSKYAMLTFDDGYYSNSLAVPVLEEFKVPAVFFISTNHVLQNKCFWWDVLYRERKQQGVPPRRIYREAVGMKSMPTEQIEARLQAMFGEDAFKPRGDIDRPFTPDELREFAGCPFVHLGNHTANHAILTNYPPEGVREQVNGAQQSLEKMTGRMAETIAYPNGGNSPTIVRTCGELGLKAGFTVRPTKNALPLPADDSRLLRLGRFCPHGDASILSQCRTYRSDLQLYGTFRSAYLRLRRGQADQ